MFLKPVRLQQIVKFNKRTLNIINSFEFSTKNKMEGLNVSASNLIDSTSGAEHNEFMTAEFCRSCAEPNPILCYNTRSGLVESVHRGEI